MVESREVLDACMLYERMRSENVDVSEKVQLELFRFVAYYNSSNIPFSEWTDWVGMRNYGESSHTIWKSGGVADLLFETLPKTDETVSILISGLCKFSDLCNLERAREIFREHRAAGGKVHREAFDALIGASPYSVSKKLAIDMAANKVAPSVFTFNALLNSAARLGKFEERVKAFTEIVAEMKTADVEPALSTYYGIFRNLVDQKLLDAEKREGEEQKAAYNRQLAVAVSWLSEIQHHITGKKLKPVTATCNLFFAEAMGLHYRAANTKLAEDLLSIYESKTNEVQMPAFTVESMFYNRYLQLVIEQTTSLSKIHDLYKSLVPRLVGVNNSLSSLVFRRMSSSPDKNWPLLRRVIVDGIAAGQMNGVLGEEMRKQLSNVQLHVRIRIVKKLFFVFFRL